MGHLTGIAIAGAIVAVGSGGCGVGRRVAVTPVAAGRSACRSVVATDSGLPAVQWRLPGDSAARRELETWCATVGPAVVATHPAIPPAVADSVAIITWNVHTGGGDIEWLVRQLQTGRVIDGHRVRQFVLLLQEAYRAGDLVPDLSGRSGPVPPRTAPEPPSGERQDILQVARDLDLALYYVPSMRNGVAPTGQPREDRGNAILSSLPLDDLTAIELPVEAQRRVAALATIRLVTESGSPWTLQVVDVHLDNRSLRGNPLRESAGPGRRRQMEQLLRSVTSDLPTVLAGDFNTWTRGSREPVVRYLTETQRFVHAPLPDWEPTFVRLWGHYTRTLDHVFYRLPPDWPARPALRIADRYGSDHHPILAWVGPDGRAVGR